MEMVSSHSFILKLASNEARTFLHVDLLLRMLQASAHQHMMIFCRFCKPWAISIIPDASDVAFAMNVWMGFRSQWISTIRSIVSTISTSELRDVSNKLHNNYYVLLKNDFVFSEFLPPHVQNVERVSLHLKALAKLSELPHLAKTFT